MTSIAEGAQSPAPAPSAAAIAAAARTVRPVDRAAELGISEGELVARQEAGEAVRLKLPAADIIRRMADLGQVMVLTRNHACVHEKDGVFDHVDLGKMMGVVLNYDIDLRIFLNNWVSGFAVSRAMDDGSVRRSLQFFDASGVAVFKLFARPETDMAAFDRLVADFTDADAEPLTVKPAPAPAADLPDSEIDLAALSEGWAGLQDVHDFFALLRKLKVGRRQALRLVGAPWSREVGLGAARQVLELASAGQVPIMCFVGNKGCIQIHSGPVKTIKVMGPWLNVLDKGFNLHLREDKIAQAFITLKPQKDSAVHSLELFDEAGELIAQFFGERKPGQPELESWQQLIAQVPSL
jgi:putative hemin transport protein